MRKAFSELANFSKMTDMPVRIDDVIHKTHIELTKEGTEAAAATAVMVAKNTSVSPRTDRIIKKVYLDRPFLYAIIDTKTGVPLFLGVINTL